MKCFCCENIGKWIVRFLILATSLLSLADLNWTSNPESSEWVVLLDISDSVRLVHERSESDLQAFYRDKIAQLADRMGAKDRIAAVYFGKEAQIAMPLSRKQSVHLESPLISGADTEIVRGMRLALALFTGSRRACAIVFTDGNVSLQAQAKIAELAKENNLQITLQSALPPDLNQFPDASLTLVLPDIARKNTDVAGYAQIETSKAGKFRVSIVSQGKMQTSHIVQAYAPGSFRSYFSLPLVAAEKQKILASVTSLSFIDRCPENNSCQKEIKTAQRAHILWIGAGENRFSKRFRITYVKPEQARGEIGHLQRYHAIVISEGNATVLGKVFPALQHYVLRGGGLFVIAGRDTLGPGGYAGTDIETALPVWCAPGNKAPVTLLVMLDISGSMGESGEGSSKLQQAKISLVRAMKSLSDSDSFSLLVFHGEASISIPFIHSRKIRKSLVSALQKIYAQGETNLLPALRLALNNFDEKRTGRKHVLLISDGLSGEQPKQILALVAKLRAIGITLSVIATGKNSAAVLQKMAQSGGGKFYRASQSQLTNFLKNDIKFVKGNLINSSTQEISDVKNAFLQRDLAEFRGTAIEKLIYTTPKSWARVLLTTGKTPVLAVGHYGLGRSAVLATNVSSEWGGSLAANGQGLVENIISWLTSPLLSTWDFRLVPIKAQVRLILHTGKKGKFRAISSWQANPIPLKQTEYGLYCGELSAPEMGIHKIVLQERIEEEWMSRKISQLVIPYPKEYKKLGFHSFELPTPILCGTNKPLAFFFLAGSISLFILERIWHFLRS